MVHAFEIYINLFFLVKHLVASFARALYFHERFVGDPDSCPSKIIPITIASLLQMMCQSILRPQRLGFCRAFRFIASVPITMLGISLTWPDHQSTAFIPDLGICDVLHPTLSSNSNRPGQARWTHGASPIPPPGIRTGRLYSESVGKEQEDRISSTWPISESASKSNAGLNGERVAVKLPPVSGDIRPTTVDTLRVRPRSDEGDAQAERDAPKGNFVELFRGSAPYIRAHRGAIMVVHIEGETVEGPGFMSLMDDLGLLTLLGVR